MNAILAAYDQARFGKSAAPTTVPTAIPTPAPPNFRGMEMTDAMRSIRNAIEESIQKERQLLGQAGESAAWGRDEVGKPATGTWAGPATAGAAIAGAGAAAGSAINKYAPSQSAVLKAVQAVRRGSGKDKGWDALLNQTVGAVPTGTYRDIDMAQAIMSQNSIPKIRKAQGPNKLVQKIFGQGSKAQTLNKLVQKIPGRGSASQLLNKLVQLSGRGVDEKIRSNLQYNLTDVLPPVVPPKTLFPVGNKAVAAPKLQKSYETSPFWRALDNKDSGRKALRERIMTDELATKGQGLWKRSPALRGALKSLGAAAAFYVLPYLWRRLSSDVAPETEEAAKLIQAQLKLADRIAAWRKAQMAQFNTAQKPEDLSLVPWADYANK